MHEVKGKHTHSFIGLQYRETKQIILDPLFMRRNEMYTEDLIFKLQSITGNRSIAKRQHHLYWYYYHCIICHRSVCICIAHWKNDCICLGDFVFGYFCFVLFFKCFFFLHFFFIQFVLNNAHAHVYKALVFHFLTVSLGVHTASTM